MTSTRLISGKEFAHLCGFSLRFLDKLAAEGRIAYVKVGRRRLFEPGEIDKLIQRHRIGGEQ